MDGSTSESRGDEGLVASELTLHDVHFVTDVVNPTVGTCYLFYCGMATHPDGAPFYIAVADMRTSQRQPMSDHHREKRLRVVRRIRQIRLSQNLNHQDAVVADVSSAIALLPPHLRSQQSSRSSSVADGADIRRSSAIGPDGAFIEETSWGSLLVVLSAMVTGDEPDPFTRLCQRALHHGDSVRRIYEEACVDVANFDENRVTVPPPLHVVLRRLEMLPGTSDRLSPPSPNAIGQDFVAHCEPLVATSVRTPTKSFILGGHSVDDTVISPMTPMPDASSADRIAPSTSPNDSVAAASNEDVVVSSAYVTHDAEIAHAARLSKIFSSGDLSMRTPSPSQVLLPSPNPTAVAASVLASTLPGGVTAPAAAQKRKAMKQKWDISYL